MPLPLALAAPLITAGGSLLGGSIQSFGAAGQNKKNRKHAERMYNQQYEDSVNFWKMQNEYNSPKAQMARLKESGLNPHLVYGNGTVANNAAAPQMPKLPDVSYQNTGEGIGQGIAQAASSGIQNYVSIQHQQLINDNLLEQKKILQQDQALKAAQLLKIIEDTENVNWRTTKDKGLYNYQLSAAKTNIDLTMANIAKTNASTEGIKIDNTIKLTREQRDAAIFAPNYAMALKRIALADSQLSTNSYIRSKILADIDSTKVSTLLKQYEYHLNERGIQKGDPLWLRGLSEMWDRLKNAANTPGNSFTDILKSLLP